MKKKGFTLIELIVVIAIIGVLAAILVPAMLGYVKRARITASNAAAKELNNAVQSALTELDSLEDQNLKATDLSIIADVQEDIPGWANGSELFGSANGDAVTGIIKEKIYTYFEDVKRLSAVHIEFANGRSLGVGVMKGSYPGSSPNQMTPEIYDGDEQAEGLDSVFESKHWERALLGATNAFYVGSGGRTKERPDTPNIFPAY